MFMNRLILILLLILIIVGNCIAKSPKLNFKRGKIKIVQITDTHYKPRVAKSEKAIENINNVLDIEQPDVVVFTGDIITGKPVFTGWLEVLKPCIEREIPYAVVLGNHDDEEDKSRTEIAHFVSKLPFSLMVPKTEGVYGHGNYIVELLSENSNSVEGLLYCFDSNAYSTKKEIKGYGWITENQIGWYKNESLNYRSLYSAELPSLAFFHIPLPEYHLAYSNSEIEKTGNRREKECAPKYNSGLFSAMVDAGDVMGVFVGHDHVNDYIASYKNIALAYGRFSGGNTTYGRMERGARVIEVFQGQRFFKTWIRTITGEKLFATEFPHDFQNAEKLVEIGKANQRL